MKEHEKLISLASAALEISYRDEMTDLTRDDLRVLAVKIRKTADAWKGAMPTHIPRQLRLDFGDW